MCGEALSLGLCKCNHDCNLAGCPKGPKVDHVMSRCVTVDYGESGQSGQNGERNYVNYVSYGHYGASAGGIDVGWWVVLYER